LRCTLAGDGRSPVLRRAILRSLVTRHAPPLDAFRLPNPRIPLLNFLLVLTCFRPEQTSAQCAGIVSTPGAAADCAAHAIPVDTVAKLDPSHPYTLAELI